MLATAVKTELEEFADLLDFRSSVFFRLICFSLLSDFNSKEFKCAANSAWAIAASNTLDYISYEVMKRQH
jgi:hypothetical protein